MQFEFKFVYLSLANLQLEWLSTVPGAVDLLAVGEGQHVVTGHSLARPAIHSKS